jgi:hypothetical protein
MILQMSLLFKVAIHLVSVICQVIYVTIGCDW